MSAFTGLSEGAVLLVGAGKMGMAMARGWIASGLPGSALTVVDPHVAPGVAEDIAGWGGHLSADLPSAPPRVIVLAVKPQIMAEVLEALRPLCSETTLILSIAAGVPIHRLESGTGATRVVRAMPNTPAQLGEGVSGAIASRSVSDADRALADGLLAAAGAVVWVEDETLIDAVTAVSGSGPAYVFNLVEAMAAAGEREGLPADIAMQLSRQTVIGAAALLASDPAPAAQLRANVTSPNGTTAAALAVLMDSATGLGPLMARAIAAARQRSEELGR